MVDGWQISLWKRPIRFSSSLQVEEREREKNLFSSHTHTHVCYCWNKTEQRPLYFDFNDDDLIAKHHHHRNHHHHHQSIMFVCCYTYFVLLFLFFWNICQTYTHKHTVRCVKNDDDVMWCFDGKNWWRLWWWWLEGLYTMYVINEPIRNLFFFRENWI